MPLVGTYVACTICTYMQIISTTNVRKNIAQLVDRVKIYGDVVGIWRRNFIDALIVQFPRQYNGKLNEITNMNVLSRSFTFLEDEPDIYSVTDMKKRYVQRKNCFA